MGGVGTRNTGPYISIYIFTLPFCKSSHYDFSFAIRDLLVAKCTSRFWMPRLVSQDLIKRIILNTTGFDVVNNAVRSRLVDQMTALCHSCSYER